MKVSSEYPQIPTVSIKQILETNLTSYRPRKMRIVCRVRDYYPRNLTDFAVGWCDLCKNTYLPFLTWRQIRLVFLVFVLWTLDFDLADLSLWFPVGLFLCLPDSGSVFMVVCGPSLLGDCLGFEDMYLAIGLLSRALLMARWKIGTSPLCAQCRIPPTDDEEGNSYRWEFSLLLEDSQGDTIPVTVAHEDAMNLLQLTPDK